MEFASFIHILINTCITWYINTCFSFIIQRLRDPTINSCNNPTIFISPIFNTTSTFLSLKMPSLFVRYDLKKNKWQIQNVSKIVLNSRKVYSNQMIHANMSSDQDFFFFFKNKQGIQSLTFICCFTEYPAHSNGIGLG